MASAKVTLGVSPKMKAEETEMVIVGGGICGILAAKQCHDRGMKYVVIEKEAKLGGVWHTMANGTSFLQVSYLVPHSSYISVHNKHSAENQPIKYPIAIRIDFLLNFPLLTTRSPPFFLNFLICRLLSPIIALIRITALIRTLLPRIPPLT